jgi:Heavy-metal resistance
MQNREIKALSAEDIAALTAGRGMGLALPAELNGYPGPIHVLELADQLGLSGEQREQVKAAFESMKAEAIPLGKKLIAAERDLDREFANQTITPERLKAATADIGAIRGELRATHLKYHLTTATLLSPEQIHRYIELRGYGQGASTSHAPTSRIHGRKHE